MSDYYGSDFQVDIQKRMLARHDWIKDAPHIANGGRVMNFLDPEVSGWDQVRDYVAQDGVVALNAMPRVGTLEKLQAMFGEGYAFAVWDVYRGAAADILQRCQVLQEARPVPEGWRLACLNCPDDASLEAIQALNAATGVSPYPGFYSRSETVPSMTACLWTETGALAATCSVNARYHELSRFRGHVFKGSTSVDPDYRGRGLGKIVNAAVLIESHAAWGWSFGLSQVAPDNPASQKTIRACGFDPVEDWRTFAVMRQGQTFTR